MPGDKVQRRLYPNNLKYVIHLHGYKVVEVADELQLPRSTLYDYVSGYRPAPKECLKSIAQLLDCEVNEFRYDLPAQTSHAVLDESPLPAQREEEPELTAEMHPSRKEPYSQLLALPMHTAIPATDAEYVAWFGKKLAYIVTMITYNLWQGRGCHNLQAWVDKEIQMFDDIKPLWASDGYSMSRREAIIAIAALPMALLTAAQNLSWSALVKQEFLLRCSASVAACWHLMAGRDFEAVRESLSAYLPTLTKWSQQPSEVQQESADLTTQGNLLLGLVSLHTGKAPYNVQGYMTYAKHATEYGKLSGNMPLYTAALMHLGGAFRYTGRREDMLRTRQLALQHLSGLSPLVQSKIFSDLAEAYGQNGQMQESLRYIEQAREVLPATIDFVPIFLSADSGPFHAMLKEGQAYLALGDNQPESDHYQQAWNALAQIEQLPPDVAIPERIRNEIVNQQAQAAVKMGDLDRSSVYLQRGIEGARALGSEKRRQEAIDIYWQARRIWPDEARITNLADLFASLN